MTTELRCKITKNPCGTDTWSTGYECPCQYCQRHIGREEGRLEGIDEALWAACKSQSADEGNRPAVERIRALAKGGKP